jgi:hypothetical protein
MIGSAADIGGFMFNMMLVAVSVLLLLFNYIAENPFDGAAPPPNKVVELCFSNPRLGKQPVPVPPL